MDEDESIYDFNIRLRDNNNNSFSMREKMSEEKLVRKILRSLLRKFHIKVEAIEEAQYLRTLKVDELIGSLKTFEVFINGRSEKKTKCIVFVSNTEEDIDQGG